MSNFKVGDLVRIIESPYGCQSLQEGMTGIVVSVGDGNVDLNGKYDCGNENHLCFKDDWIEHAAPENTIQLNETYTSKNGQKWQCIAVRGDTAWLVAGSGKGAAYTFKLDGTNICQGGGEWDIKWKPVVEWVELPITYDAKRQNMTGGHLYNDGYVRANINFPLIDGVPDFAQATVTPV